MAVSESLHTLLVLKIGLLKLVSFVTGFKILEILIGSSSAFIGVFALGFVTAKVELKLTLRLLLTTHASLSLAVTVLEALFSMSGSLEFEVELDLPSDELTLHEFFIIPFRLLVESPTESVFEVRVEFKSSLCTLSTLQELSSSVLVLLDPFNFKIGGGCELITVSGVVLVAHSSDEYVSLKTTDFRELLVGLLSLESWSELQLSSGVDIFGSTSLITASGTGAWPLLSNTLSSSLRLDILDEYVPDKLTLGLLDELELALEFRRLASDTSVAMRPSASIALPVFCDRESSEK